MRGKSGSPGQKVCGIGHLVCGEAVCMLVLLSLSSLVRLKGSAVSAIGRSWPQRTYWTRGAIGEESRFVFFNHITGVAYTIMLVHYRRIKKPALMSATTLKPVHFCSIVHL